MSAGLVFLPLIAAFVLSFLGTGILINLAPKLGLIDNPKTSKHPGKLHLKPIPTGAGVVFLASILPVMAIALPWEKRFIGIACGLTLAAVVGVADDKFNLNPYTRLIFNFLTAAVIVGTGTGIAFITNPFDGLVRFDQIRLSFDFFGEQTILPVAAIFALFWIVFVANMINWSAGVDGQIPGMVIITAIVLSLLSARFVSFDPSQIQLIKLAVILAGSAAGFLIFNWHPAKIFPGYGVTVWGFLIATLAILAGAKVATAILVLAIPFADGTVTIARRILSGKSPVWADRGHLHHLLLAKGLTQPQIAGVYWLATGVLGYLALNLSSSAKVFAAVMVGILVIGVILWLKLILTEK